MIDLDEGSEQFKLENANDCFHLFSFFSLQNKVFSLQ